MHKRLEKYLVGTRFAGIEIELRNDEAVFHVVVLKRTGNKLSVEQVFSEIKSPGELPAKNIKDIPVSVVVTGKGLLYRQVPADPDSSPEILLRKILPNVNPDEFFVSSKKNGTGHYVSLARRSVIDRVCAEVKKHCTVVALEVGSHCLDDVRSFLSGNLIRSGRHTIAFDDQSISSVEYLQDEESAETENVFTIGGQTIPGHALVAFAIGFRIATGNYISLETGLHNEFVQQKLFRTALRAAIIFVFAILSVNYFVFSHYWNLQQKLESSSGSEGGAVEEVNMLREQVAARSNFLESAGLLNNSSFAWYADQLAHNMPDGIRLSQINFSPRIKLTEEDTIGFRGNAIEISGNCEESIVLNRWIQFLQGEQWISSASIRSYEQNKSDATGKFTLDLQLH